MGLAEEVGSQSLTAIGLGGQDYRPYLKEPYLTIRNRITRASMCSPWIPKNCFGVGEPVNDLEPCTFTFTFSQPSTWPIGYDFFPTYVTFKIEAVSFPWCTEFDYPPMIEQIYNGFIVDLCRGSDSTPLMKLSINSRDGLHQRYHFSSGNHWFSIFKNFVLEGTKVPNGDTLLWRVKNTLGSGATQWWMVIFGFAFKAQ